MLLEVVLPRLWPTAFVLVAACATQRPLETSPTAAVPPVPSAAPAPTPLPASIAPAGEDPRIHEIVRAVSPVRLERDLRRLLRFGTRHTLSDTVSATRGIGAARRDLFKQFQQVSAACGGCLEVRYVSDIVPGDPKGRIPRDTRVVNIVAIQRGRTEPNRHILMTAHYDSRVTDVMDAVSEAPGANDNGSGTVALLEAARVLSRYPTDATIVYAALAGEEQGLHGGHILAQYAKANNWDIAAVLNNDIIGNTEGISGVVENTTARIFAPGIPPTADAAELRRYMSYGGELDTPTRQLARYIARTAERYIPNLEVQPVYRLDRFGRGGDHTPFFLAGYPAVRITETNENYHRQHQDLRTENGIRYGDVIEGVNFPYLAKMTSLNAAAIASLAWAPPAPSNVRVSGAVQPSTTLRWDPVSVPDLAGYRVYWRSPTSPVWQHSRWVGTNTQAVLENIVIDNSFFGVVAVDREGHESLPVFPRPGQ